MGNVVARDRLDACVYEGVPATDGTAGPGACATAG
jgi:hypothetical protein